MNTSAICIFLLNALFLATLKGKAQARDSSEIFNGRSFGFGIQDRQPNRNDEKQSRALDLLRLEALAEFPGSQLGGLPGSHLGISRQNENQRTDRSLLNAFPSHLNGLLSQGLVGNSPGLIGTNPNLIRGQSGLLGGLPGLVAGTSGLGNTPPLGALSGRSPIGDIMAMASFLTKDELHDMFSQDKNFNFIPVILQDSKEEQEVENFIRFINKRSEKEKESSEASNNEFDKRGQRSLNNNPLLAQANVLQRLTQQQNQLAQNNLLQHGLSPLLQSQNLLQSGTPNHILTQQNALRGAGINPLFALQAPQNSLQGSGINPILAIQAQLQSGILQSTPNNIFSDPRLSQLQDNQAGANGLGFNQLIQQARLQEARLQQSLQPQHPQLQALQQLLLQQGRDTELLREREISATLPREHKDAPFRFPRD